MKNTTEDLIMAEMHDIKDSNSARFGHDIDWLFRHLKNGFAENAPVERHMKSILTKLLRATGKQKGRVAKTMLHV
jgi:hypothetical protein